jgi:hypothetical protein
MRFQFRRSKFLGFLRCYSADGFKTVSLAYTLHELPHTGGAKRKDSAVIFLHGLFGSRKNNRSMSR